MNDPTTNDNPVFPAQTPYNHYRKVAESRQYSLISISKVKAILNAKPLLVTNTSKKQAQE
jgi:hypothetical protein